jgi:2-succinyl-5-enolpyruvyl-6-hydroxy-3-cyclohexene-1-carboxylate synthase
MNPSTAFGTVLADELARCGLREVVVAPGSRSTPLAIAFWELERAGRVRLHVRIDERSASFTALGLAKASRRPVAVLCTSGTAAANFHPAVLASVIPSSRTTARGRRHPRPHQPPGRPRQVSVLRPAAGRRAHLGP